MRSTSTLMQTRSSRQVRPSSPKVSAPRPWLAAVLLGIAIVTCYSNSLFGPFVFDDQFSIVMNPTLGQLGDTGRLGSLRGLVDFSFAVNHALGGLNPLGFHLVNLAIHILAGLTLFGLLRRTLSGPKLVERFGSQAEILAVIVALLWSVHPLATEAVTYICQRFESTAALFYLLGLYAFCRGSEPAANRKLWYSLVVVCYALGLRSKETAITFPLVLVWYDRAFVSNRWRDLLDREVLYGSLVLITVVLAGATLAPTLLTLSQEIVKTPGESSDVVEVPKTSALIVEGMTPWTYMWSQPGVILHYLRLCFWPTGQCFYSDWPIARTAGEVVPPLLVILGLLAAIVWAIFRCPRAAFLGGAFFLYLAPTSSIVPIRDLMVEHRMYLPLAAVIAFVVVAMSQVKALSSRHALSLALVGTAVFTLAMLTWTRNQVYSNEIDLWQDTCRQTPLNSRAYYGLGYAFNNAQQFGPAIDALQKAVSIRPDFADAQTALGMALFAIHRDSEAIDAYRKALASEPNLGSAHVNLGVALQRIGRRDEAIVHFERALWLNPKSTDARFNLAGALAAQNRLTEAFTHYHEGLRVAPDYLPAYQSAGAAFYNAGRYDQAAVFLARAAEIAPRNAELRNMLGLCLARSGNLSQAVESFHAALAIDSGCAAPRKI